MPVITSLLAIALFVLVLAAGLTAIGGVVYWLTRNDIYKSERLRWLTTLTHAVVAVFTVAISGGLACLLARHLFRIGPDG